MPGPTPPFRFLEDKMNISISGRIVGRGLVGLAALMMSSAAFAAPTPRRSPTASSPPCSARDGATATYGAASQSGDVVTISDFKVNSPKRGEITVPAIVVTGATDRQPGGFTASSIAFDAGTIAERDNTVTWTTGHQPQRCRADPCRNHRGGQVRAVLGIRDHRHHGLRPQGPAEPGQGRQRHRQAGRCRQRRAVLDERRDLGHHGAARYGSRFAGQGPRRRPLLGDTLNLDILVDGTFDAAKQTTTFQQISVDSPGLGKLSISGTFGGMPLDKMASPDAGSAAADTATIENATIRFDNYGIGAEGPRNPGQGARRLALGSRDHAARQPAAPVQPGA